MEAHIFHDNIVTKKCLKYLSNIDNNSIIIATNLDFYRRVEDLNLAKVIFVDPFEDSNSTESEKIVKQIIKLVDHEMSLFFKSVYTNKVLINKVYNNISMVINTVLKIQNIVKKYNIKTLVLYGGSDEEQLLGMNLAEGERPFRYLYKREWFLNNFIHNAFGDTLKIVWINKSNKMLLRFIKVNKVKSILLLKKYFLIKKVLQSKNSDRNGENIAKDAAIFVVRNPIQVNALLPFYNKVKNESELKATFLTFENYSNNSLQKVIKDKKIESFDIFNFLKASDINQIYKELNLFIKRKKNSEKTTFHFDINIIKIDIHSLINDLSIYWFDILVFKLGIDNFLFKSNINPKIIINNETHGYHAAIQYYWSNSMNVPNIGLQHVVISDKYLPRISWNDIMFLMSNKIKSRLTDIKPLETFEYLGPIAYDNYFNTTKHRGEFNKITVFTQPDDFKQEYFKIIEDLIRIKQEYNLNFKIEVKLHPREKDAKSYHKIVKKYSGIEVIGKEKDSNYLIQHSDVVISINSGVLMQAIIIGTPSISVNYDNKFTTKLDFIENDVTKKVYSFEMLKSIILNLEVLGVDYQKARRDYMKYELNDYNGNAADKIYKYLNINEL